MTQTKNNSEMPRNGLPAHIEVLSKDSGSRDEIRPEAAATEQEVDPDSDPSITYIAYRFIGASLELAHNIRHVGRITMRGQFGEMLTDALRRNF